MSESVDDTGANAETGKGTRTGHVMNFGNVLPGLVVFCEFAMNKF